MPVIGNKEDVLAIWKARRLPSPVRKPALQSTKAFVGYFGSMCPKIYSRCKSSRDIKKGERAPVSSNMENERGLAASKAKKSVTKLVITKGPVFVSIRIACNNSSLR